MGARQVLALGGAALGALAALNSALAPAPRPPSAPTVGRTERFQWSGHTLHYTVAGEGPALTLIHGIDIAASSFEMRFIAEPLARAFQVYALDLLGFGLSERPDLHYTPQLYVRLIVDFLETVIQRPTALIASGLSAAYCIAAAASRPQLVRALVLSEPPRPSAQPVPAVRRAVDKVLGAPIVGQSVYNVMTARTGIRALLRDRAYYNPELITEGMVDIRYALAHQPQARHAVRAYLGGRLDLDVAAAFSALRQPVLLVFGSASSSLPHNPEDAYLRLNPRAQVLHLERCGAMPHEEQAESFHAAIASWLGA